MIEKRVKRTGDGTSPSNQKLIQHTESDTCSAENIGSNLIWGWGDADLNENDKSGVIITNRI